MPPKALHDQLTRWSAWGRTFLTRLKQRHWLIPIAGGAGFFLLNLVVGDILSPVITRSLADLWRGVAWLATRPLHYGALFVLVVVLILLILSFFETSPAIARLRTRQVVKAPVVLSAEDRECTQHIRAFWRLHGRNAAMTLGYIFTELMQGVRESKYWGELLQPTAQEIDRTIRGLDDAVEMDSSLPFAEVRSRFNEFYAAYYGVIVWTAKVAGNGDLTLPRDSYEQRIAHWRRLQATFNQKLQELHERPENHGKLAIFAPPFNDDPHVVRFLTGTH